MKKSKLLLPLISLFSILLSACVPISSSETPSSSEEPSSGESSVEPPSSTCDEDDMWCDVGGGGDSSVYVPPVVDMVADESEGYSFENVSLETGSMAYEVFVRSFYDADGDGIGDFNGLKQKLPYLASLGINTLWLMPIHPSPTYHGYDVKDYYAVNPQFGSMNEFKSLLADAHNLGMKIIIDMVLNHSSKQHPWLEESYLDRANNNIKEDSKADWYVWSDKDKSSYHSYRNAYYEGQFDASMPDFNYDSPSFRKEVENIIKFWANDIGVDGFRLDAVKYYYMNQTVKNRDILTWFKQTAIQYNKDFFMVGECWDSNETIESYYDSECDSFFKFSTSLEGVGAGAIAPQIKRFISANGFGEEIEKREATIKEKNPNGYYSYFLANHDMDRASNSFKGINAKMAASLYCLLPGMPYMYYGEEIEIKGIRQTNDHSDVRRRLPMVWSKDNKEGECTFPETNRQDLNNNDQVELGVLDLQDDPLSLLNHYKKAINVRNKYPFMKHGIFTNRCADLNTEDEHVLAYEISLDDESIVIIHNFNNYNVEVDVTNIGDTIDSEINTGRYIPQISNGKLKLGMNSTVVIK